MRIYNLFHSNLLKPTAKNLLPGQCNNPLPPVVVNDKKKWEADNILNAKKRKRQVLF